ncbi:hypothetical protein [Paenibacillus jiagnxiensis]|uniref:hypothetical protein n=1 Tax=Paenibacillus jiagnxiensis TaxID=3228926 RepID=UPI0033AA1B37
MKLISIDNCENYNFYWTEIISQNSRVFHVLESKKEEIGYPFRGFALFNLDNNHLSEFVFPESNVFRISTVGGSDTVYYLNEKISAKSISFHKCEINKNIHTVICELDIGSLYNADIGDQSYTKPSISIYGIDDRYMILSIDSLDGRKKQWSLLDCTKKTFFSFSDPILNRLETISILEKDNHSYIILKTGQVHAKEKEELWRENSARLLKEEIIVIDSGVFIDQILNGILNLGNFIVDLALNDAAIVNYSIIGDSITYLKQHFKENITIIVNLNPEDLSKKCTTFNGLFNYIWLYEDGAFSYNYDDKGLLILDLKDNKILTRIDSHALVLNVNARELVTYNILENNNLQVRSINLINNKEKVLAEGRILFVESKNNSIILLK